MKAISLSTEIYNGHRFDIMQDNETGSFFTSVYANDHYDDNNETSITIGGNSIEECRNAAKVKIGNGNWN